MNENFLNSFVNTYSTKNLTPSFKHGQFSILNRTTASAEYPGGNQLADLRLRTDFQCIGKQKTLHTDSSFNDYNGFNTEYISDAGVFIVENALKQFARTDFGRRVVTRDIEAHIRSLTHRDCHTPFLYNMLISWGKALLYKMNGDTDQVLRVRCSPYISEHVTVGLPDLNDRIYEIPMGEPSDPMRAPQFRRTDQNYFTKPYVLHYNGSTAEQEWFYLVHVHSRTNVSALNFDLPVPGIDRDDTIVLDPVDPHGDEVDADALETVPWEDPDTIWKWIIDYVSLNRLEQQFASTLETFGSMFFHPMWSSAEACQWQMSEIVAVLGTFEPTRARLRTNLEGNPYSSDPTAVDFVMGAQVKPVSYLMSSAIMNYYMWYGLYAVLNNDAEDRDAWRTVFTSVRQEMQMLYTPHMRAFTIGVLLNQEIPTNMTHGAGFYVSLDRMENVYSIINTKPGTSGEHAVVNIEALYAPVSGSLVLGTMSGDLDAVQHLKSIYSVEFSGTRTRVYDKYDLVKTATIYRLFGHNITLFDNVTQDRIEPWAAVNECVIEPASVSFDATKVVKLTLGWSDAREGRTVPLPALGSLGQEGYIKVTIQKPHLEFIQHRTAQTPVKTYTVQRTNRKPLPIMVKSSYSYRPETFRSMSAMTYKQSGFHSDKLQPSPALPEGEKIVAPIQTSVITEDVSQPVKLADSNIRNEESQGMIAASSSEHHTASSSTEKTTQSLSPISQTATRGPTILLGSQQVRDSQQ